MKGSFQNLFFILAKLDLLFTKLKKSSIGDFLLEKILFRQKGFYSVISIFTLILVSQLSASTYSSKLSNFLDEKINNPEYLPKIVWQVIEIFSPEGNISITIIISVVIFTILILRYFELRNKKRKINYNQFLKGQLERKVQVFKDNKKYIPNVFLELDNIKESLRILTQPHLFYEKSLEELQLIDFDFFNTVYKKVGLSPVNLDISEYESKSSGFSALKEQQELLVSYLDKFVSKLPDLEDRHSFKNSLDEESYKVIVKEYGTSRRISWIIEDYQENLALTGTKKLIFLTEKAGQGKTNLVCDFVENVMLKKGLLGVFLTGNEFSNLTRESIESILLKSILGFQSDVTFDEVLEDLGKLCNQKSITFTIIIDGLNENSNIELFSKELHDFVERILQYNFIRLIFTCRSEYFKERFKDFLEPSFKKEMVLYDGYMSTMRNNNQGIPDFLQKRLIDSYFEFFQVENNVFKNVRQQLANNFLLLRIFCEVYGEKDNLAPNEQVYSIYKEDLFGRYYQNKIDQIQRRKKYTATDFRNTFEVLLSYMVEKLQFINIPFGDLPSLNQELMDEIFHEDILFRKDLVQDKNSVFANKEVLNFTFDEFRDYLLVDYLVHSELNIIEFLSKLSENNTSLEGLEKYLFIKSRKTAYRGKLQELETLPHFDELFLNNIFSVNDDDIDSIDIEKISDQFMCGFESSRRIIQFLMFRHRTNHYKNLNINTLFNIIEKLSDEEYSKLICPLFDIKRGNYSYSYSNKREGFLLDLISQLEDILARETFDDHSEYHNVFKLMILLLGVNDHVYHGTPYELIDLLESYIAKYPNEALESLTKYSNFRQIKVQKNIFRLLNGMIENGFAQKFTKSFPD